MTPIVEYQQNAADLLDQFSIAMQQLLKSKNLSPEDQLSFSRTLEIVNTVGKRYFETAEQIEELEHRRRMHDVEYAKNALQTMLILKEKEANQSMAELQQLREQAECLQLSLEGVAKANFQLLPFNRREVYLKATHPQFCGREHILLDIKSKCISSIPVVLHGPPGIGKTETAIAFGNKYIVDYSVIWTIDAETEERCDFNYRQLAESLCLPVFRKDSPTVIRKRVHKKLEELEKPWLLIFDKLEEPIDFPQRGGHILITSRTKEFFPSYPDTLIPPFSDEEAIGLLKKSTGEDASDAMQKLALHMENYPFLLAQVGNHIHITPHISIESYTKTLTDIDESRITFDERYKFKLSELVEQTLPKLPPLVLQWLRICSHLSPEDIPQKYFQWWNPYEGNQMDQVFATLINRGWFRYDRSTNTIFMYRFFQKCIRREAEYLEATDLVLQIGDAIDFELATDRWSDSLREAQAWAPHLKKIMHSQLFATLPASKKALCKFFLGMWKYLLNEFASASQLLEEASSQLTDPIKRAACLKNWGSASLFVIIQFAREKHEVALKILEENDLTDHYLYASCLHNSGICLLRENNHLLARQKFEDALKIWKKDSNPKPLLIGIALINLGDNFQAEKDYPSAMEKYREALEVFGEKHPKQIVGYDRIGRLHIAQNKLSEAMKWLQKALEICDEYDEFGLYKGSVYTAIATVFRLEKKYEQAIENLNKGLELFIGSLGRKSPITIANIHDIGLNLMLSGKHPEALLYFQEAYNSAKESLGDDHSLTKLSETNLEQLQKA